MTDDRLKPGERHLEADDAEQGLEQEQVRGVARETSQGEYAVGAVAGDDRNLRTEAAGLLAGQTDRLTLYEERAHVQVVRESVGAVTVRKVVREREEMVPVTLRTECLEIVVREGAGCVRMGEQELQPGQSYEVELTTERASVHKEIVPISEVSFEKRAVQQDMQETVTLRREVLDIEDPQGLVANRTDLLDDLR